MSWSFALKNLFRNKRRTMATGAAIVAGFIGLVLLGGYIYRTERLLFAQSVYLMYHGHISILKLDSLEKYASNPGKYQITESELTKVRQITDLINDEIEHIGFTLTGMGLISNGSKSLPFLASGVDSDTIDYALEHPMVKKWGEDFLTQDSLQFRDEVHRDDSAISITPLLGNLINRPTPFDQLEEGKRSVQLAGMTIYNDLNAVNGILASSHTTGSQMTESTGLFATLKLLQDLYSTESVQSIVIYLKDASSLSQVAARLNRSLKDAELDLVAYSFDHPDISQMYVGAIDFLYVMAGFFVFLIFGTVILSIVNSLTMGILERAREIGTLRAMGYTNHQISLGFTRESICLVVISCCLGIVLAWMASAAVNTLNIRFYPVGAPNSIQLVLAPNIYFTGTVFFILSLLVGLFTYWLTKKKLQTSTVNLLSDSGA